MLIETFLRKQLGLKAHTVTKVEETEKFMVVDIDRLGSRLLRCGLCRQRCRKVHSLQKPRVWRDLSISDILAPRRRRKIGNTSRRPGVGVEFHVTHTSWIIAFCEKAGQVERGACFEAGKGSLRLALLVGGLLVPWNFQASSGAQSRLWVRVSQPTNGRL